MGERKAARLPATETHTKATFGGKEWRRRQQLSLRRPCEHLGAPPRDYGSEWVFWGVLRRRRSARARARRGKARLSARRGAVTRVWRPRGAGATHPAPRRAAPRVASLAARRRSARATRRLRAAAAARRRAAPRTRPSRRAPRGGGRRRTRPPPGGTAAGSRRRRGPPLAHPSRCGTNSAQRSAAQRASVTPAHTPAATYKLHASSAPAPAQHREIRSTLSRRLWTKSPRCQASLPQVNSVDVSPRP